MDTLSEKEEKKLSTFFQEAIRRKFWEYSWKKCWCFFAI